jgi:hypothetical protein
MQEFLVGGVIVMQKRVFSFLSMAVWLVLMRLPATAQSFRATIVGRVTDSGGLSIPQAEVAAVNSATQARSVTHTDNDGNFLLTELPPGSYDLSAKANGFGPYVRRGIVLAVGDRANVSVQLEVGQVSSSVAVTAELTGVETNQDITGQLMDTQHVTDLPLNGRQAFMLLQLSSGVVFTQQFFGPGGFSGTRAYDVNGEWTIQGSYVNPTTNQGSNAFMLDGAPLGVNGQWDFSPVVDGIEEYKVQMPTNDASLGLTGGGVINMTMKSGSNAIHGVASYFLRNQLFDAQTTQQKASCAVRPDQCPYQHQFNEGSVVVTGPIIRDKFFYSGSYETFWDRVPRPLTETVPTALQRQGDFSQTLNAAGRLVTIYDPLTTVQSGSVFTRRPFAGNIIPADRIAAVSKNILNFVPMPNIVTNPITNFNNLGISPNIGRFRYNAWFMKFDYQWNDKNRTFFSETQNYGSNNSSNNGLPTGNPAKVGSDPARRNHYGTTLDHVYTMNGSTVIDLRAAWDRYLPYLFETTDDNVDGSELGFEGPTGSYPAARFPSLKFSNYLPLGNTGDNYLPIDTYTLAGNLSRAINRHVLRFGVRLGLIRSSILNTGPWFGAFAFTPAWTQANPLAASTTSGNDMASFLLGYPDSGSTTSNTQGSVQNKSFSLYAQDDFRVTSKLTLNLGLRWDVQTAPTERYNRSVYTFDPSQTYQLGPSQATGQLIFADSDHRQAWDTKFGDFQPRLGLAWQASKRLVVRTGFGTTVVPLNGDGGMGSVVQTGFSFTTPFVPTLGGGADAYIPGMPGTGTLPLPFPNGILAPQLPAVPYGQAVTFTDRGYKIPLVYQFNAGFSYDLPWSTVLEASYVGSRTTRYPVSQVLSAIPLSAVEQGVADPSFLTKGVPNPFYGAPQLAGTSLNSPTIPRSQALSPYPQFASVTENGIPIGSTSYNALQIRLRKRLGSGLSFTGSYTFSKTMQTLSYLAPQYTTLEHVLVPFDRSQHLSISSLMQLPFGKGKHFGSNWGTPLDMLAGGWQLNVIYEYMTGTPTPMPNATPVRNPAIPNQSYDEWFDTCTLLNNGSRSGCSSPTAPITWVQLKPNQLPMASTSLPHIRNPWAANVNVSLFKQFDIKERAKLELRGEAFNATNTPIYQGPNTSITSPLFGVVTRSQQNFPRNMQLALRLQF